MYYSQQLLCYIGFLSILIRKCVPLVFCSLITNASSLDFLELHVKKAMWFKDFRHENKGGKGYKVCINLNRFDQFVFQIVKQPRISNLS